MQAKEEKQTWAPTGDQFQSTMGMFQNEFIAQLGFSNIANLIILFLLIVFFLLVAKFV